MTATEVREQSPRLRAALAELRTMGDAPRVRLALAEAEFRLAIADGTGAEEGIELLRSAVRHDPYLVKGYLHLGRLLHRTGRHRAALPEYLAALKIAPGSRRIHLLLAEALLELGKAEQQAGEELIAALAARRPERVAAAVTGIEELLAPEPGAEDADRGEKKTARKRAKPPADLTEIWQIWLLTQLGRSARPAQAVASLRAAAAQVPTAGPVDFAVGCLLLAAEAPDELRKVLASAGIDPAGAGPGDPALRALNAALTLVEEPDPATFVRAAAQSLATGTLPAAVVCWLHWTRFGRPADRPVIEALRLLDAYPPAIRADGWFIELRIAVLDAYAHAAWAAGELVQARLLWRETIGLDPHRAPVAMNLALLAARMNAADEYGPAWERLFELRYLLSAGVGDVQLDLAERRDLHLALTRQAWQRYCAPTPPGAMPTPEQLDAFVADADALTVWLRDWDRYYVNARLSFRSPVHLLGAARDAATAELAEARDALVELTGTAIAGSGWAGTAVFQDLAVAEIEGAYARAAEPVDRARDPYFEMEKQRADALADEMVHRTLVLRELLWALGRRPVAAVPAGQAATVLRHQRGLPQRVLQSLFVNRGLLANDVTVAEVVESAVLRLAESWAKQEPAAAAPRLAELAEALPHRLDLHVVHCRALHAAERPRQAYAAAVAALALPGTDDEDARQLRAILADLVERIGYDDIPAALLQPADVAAAERTIAAAEASIRRYPASSVPRSLLAQVLLMLGGDARQRQAAGVLVTGIVEALDDEPATRLQELLDRVPRQVAAAAAGTAIADTLVRSDGGVARVARCRALAQRYAPARVSALDAVLTRLRTGGE